MVKWSSFLISVCSVALALSGLFLSGCRPGRPQGVPSDTTYVDGGKTNWWQRCEYDSKKNEDRCQIFNEGGKLIYDEAFLPYDEQKVALSSELKIDGSASLAGPSIICLKNGRILLPKSKFASQKSFVDAKLKGH
jgi:hypothetical protein